MITSKFKSWEYEEEWRIFHPESGTLYGYETKALIGIYFGSAMEFTHQKIITLILCGQNPTVQLYRRKRNTESFLLDFEPLNYTPYIERKNAHDT